jgi:hypothetical protein
VVGRHSLEQGFCGEPGHVCGSSCRLLHAHLPYLLAQARQEQAGEGARRVSADWGSSGPRRSVHSMGSCGSVRKQEPHHSNSLRVADGHSEYWGLVGLFVLPVILSFIRPGACFAQDEDGSEDVVDFQAVQKVGAGEDGEMGLS